MSIKIKVIVSAVASAAVLTLVILGFFGMDGRTNSMVVEYLNSLGWQVGDRPVEISHFKIPDEFDTVFYTYNAFQLEAGFDLSGYCGARVARYSYAVRNHSRSETGEVRANVYVHKQKIVAADISQSGRDGFMQPVTDMSDMIK